MIYAPVIIPVMNRPLHLKRCLDSLKKNKFAKLTEVYISVDFPPSKTYVDGWRNVKEYLALGVDGFKHVNIIYQDKNLGPVKNIAFLVNMITIKYDRWIFTEDDNEFSPNFIEYIDKGLDIFESDRKVLAVCGSCDVPLTYSKKNANKLIYFCPYGFGIWSNRYNKLESQCMSILLDRKNMGIHGISKIFHQSKWVSGLYVSNVLCDNHEPTWKSEKELSSTDIVQNIYIIFENMSCIFPRKNKSRTRGNDGSGVNMKDKKEEDNLPALDTDVFFNYEIDINSSINEELSTKISMEMYKKNGKIFLIKALIRYVLFLMTNKNRSRYLYLKKLILIIRNNVK